LSCSAFGSMSSVACRLPTHRCCRAWSSHSPCMPSRPTVCQTTFHAAGAIGSDVLDRPYRLVSDGGRLDHGICEELSRFCAIGIFLAHPMNLSLASGASRSASARYRRPSSSISAMIYQRPRSGSFATAASGKPRRWRRACMAIAWTCCPMRTSRFLDRARRRSSPISAKTRSDGAPRCSAGSPALRRARNSPHLRQAAGISVDLSFPGAVLGDRPGACDALHRPFPLAGLLAAIFILPEVYGFELDSSPREMETSPVPSGT
jgi:hypothetical protein